MITIIMIITKCVAKKRFIKAITAITRIFGKDSYSSMKNMTEVSVQTILLRTSEICTNGE